MILKYYLWVSKTITRLEKSRAFRPRKWSLWQWLVVVLVTGPVWLAVIVVDLLPISSDAKLVLWVVIFLATIAVSVRLLYLLHRMR